jgi:hypothetical protein
MKPKILGIPPWVNSVQYYIICDEANKLLNRWNMKNLISMITEIAYL